jgi:hypothetical protein
MGRGSSAALVGFVWLASAACGLLALQLRRVPSYRVFPNVQLVALVASVGCLLFSAGLYGAVGLSRTVITGKSLGGSGSPFCHLQGTSTPHHAAAVHSHGCTQP